MSQDLVVEEAAPAAFADGSEVLTIAEEARSLGRAARGHRGVIVRVSGELAKAGVLEAHELERRLLELGFVEGATVEILHQGLFFRDPIAVKLDDMRVALRRREAAAIEVRFENGHKV